MTEQQSSGLELLTDPSTKTFNINGTEYTVGPVRMGRLKRFSETAEAVLPVIGALLAAGEGGNDLDILVSESADDLIDFLQAATGIERERINEARTDEFIIALVAIVAVNLGFFVQRLRLLKAEANQITTAGETAFKP